MQKFTNDSKVHIPGEDAVYRVIDTDLDTGEYLIQDLEDYSYREWVRESQISLVGENKELAEVLGECYNTLTDIVEMDCMRSRPATSNHINNLLMKIEGVL